MHKQQVNQIVNKYKHEHYFVILKQNAISWIWYQAETEEWGKQFNFPLNCLNLTNRF